MKNEMKRGLALLLCLAMVVGVFVGVPGMTTVANAAESTSTLAAVPNGDFETVVRPNWTLSSTSVSIVPGAGMNDSTALRIVDVSGSHNAISDKVSVVPGVSYTFSAYMKGDMKAVLDIVWYSSDGAEIKTNSYEPQTTGTWTKYSVTATAPENTASASVRIRTGATATGTVYVDNVSFGTQINKLGTDFTSFTSNVNLNSAEVTTTYNPETDTASLTHISGSGYAVAYELITVTANTDYVVEFTLSNTVNSNSSYNDIQGIVALANAGGTSILHQFKYGIKTGGTTTGDATYTYEFNSGENTSFQLQMRARKQFVGTYDLSGLKVYPKAAGKVDNVLNSGFEDVSIPGWTFNNNNNTSNNGTTIMMPSDGNNNSKGVALYDHYTGGNHAGMISDKIKIDSKFWRQNVQVTFAAMCPEAIGMNVRVDYFDADGNPLKPTTEVWSGGGIAGWQEFNCGLTSTTNWAGYTAKHGNSRHYIPYGTDSLQIKIWTGAAANQGTLYIDDVALNVICSHKDGTIADATVEKSALVHHKYVAPTYAAAGSVEYYECSNCCVKYADADAKNVLTGDTTIAKYQVLTNIDKGNSLALLFALKEADLTALGINPDNVTVDMVMDGKSETDVDVEKFEDDDYGTLYRVKFSGIAAKEMARYVNVTFKNNGETFATHDASVRSYADGCIKSATTTEAWKNVCYDMLDYGAAAQIHWNHVTSLLANKGITNQAGTVFVQDKTRQDVTDNGKFVASAVRFQCNLSMLFAVDATTEYTKAVISFTNHHNTPVEVEATTVVTQEVNGRNALCFEFDGMVVADIDSEITFTVYNGEEVAVQVIDSMDAYIGRVTDTESTMYALAQAFGKFATSAYDYHH